MTDELIKSEVYDVDVLYKLRTKDFVPKAIKQKLKLYSKQTIQGNRVRVGYNFGKNYQTIKKGRLYANPRICLEGFPHEIRAALAQKYYWEVDMVNAQPVLLVNLAKRFNLGCPALEEYCTSRETVLQTLINEYSMTRDEAKTICLSVIFGGLRYQHPLLPRMYEELSHLAVLVSNQNPDLLSVASKDKDMKPKNNPQGSCLAVYIQNEERLVLQHLDAFFSSKGRSLDVLIFDGGLLRKTENETHLDNNLLREAEEYLLDKTGFNVKLAVKPLEHTFDLEDKETIYTMSDMIDTAFACQKFISYYPDMFLLDNSDLFMRHPDTDLWVPYNLEDTKVLVLRVKNRLIFKQDTPLGIRLHNYGGDIKNVLLMLSWLPQYAPKGQVPIEFKGSLGDVPDLTSPESLEIIDLYSQLLSIVSNNNSDKKTYLTKYLAHSIQRPRELPGVCLVVTGGQGCGKDTTFKVFMDYVIGGTYAKNYDRNDIFFNFYDSHKSRKVMLKLQEANGKDCAENSHNLKALVTESRITLNPKHKNQMEVDNFARCIFTTNEGNPIQLEGDDRRYVLYDCSLEKVGDHEFWTKVYNLLMTDKAGQILYHHFLHINLDGFQIRQFPVSEYQEEVQQAWRSIEELFIEDWDGEEATVDTIYAKYRSFCLRLRLKEDSICNKLTFGKRLAAFSRDQKILKRLKDGYPRYRKPDTDPQIE